MLINLFKIKMGTTEEAWNNFIDYFGTNEFKLFLYGAFIYQIAIYWTMGSIFLKFGSSHKSNLLRRYKIQPVGENLDDDKVAKCIVQVIFNQIFVSFQVFFIASTVRNYINVPNIRKLPSIQEVCVDLIVGLIIYEILFFYSHLILHSKFFYNRIHKRHHEWTCPISITYHYGHPIDHIFCNLIPMICGVLKSHILSVFIWFTVILIYNQLIHCGYHLPFLPSPETRDYHHSHPNECFGNLQILDTLHRTNKIFKKSIEYKRDTIIFSLTPAKLVYPEEQMITAIPLAKKPKFY